MRLLCNFINLNYKELFVWISALCWLFACDKTSHDKPARHEQQTNKVVLDNSYLQIKSKVSSEELHYSIKKVGTRAVFIQNDGTVIENSDVSRISLQQIGKNKYVIIPDNHWFTKLFLNNPFMDTGLNLARPSLWGFSFKHIKTENGGTLWQKGLKLAHQELNKIIEDELKRIIPNYNAKLLGKGATGSVYEVLYKGTSYLKENASET